MLSRIFTSLKLRLQASLLRQSTQIQSQRVIIYSSEEELEKLRESLFTSKDEMDKFLIKFEVATATENLEMLMDCAKFIGSRLKEKHSSLSIARDNIERAMLSKNVEDIASAVEAAKKVLPKHQHPKT